MDTRPTPIPRRAHLARERGMAMITVLILIVGMAGLAAALLIRLTLENKSAEEYIRLQSASIAAEAGLEYATDKIWGNYLLKLGNGLPMLSGYRDYLDAVVQRGGMAKLLEKPIQFVNGAVIDQVMVERQDTGTETVLTVRSQANFLGRTRVVTQSFRCTGEAFSGFDYALLANNISCVLCHAEFDNVERYYNTDPEKFGTFDRVKVASLESLIIRLNDSKSKIAGTLYTRGEMLGTKGSSSSGISKELSPVTTLAGSSFQGYAIDPSGKIQQDKKGRLINTKLDMALEGKDGLLPKYGEVYANYPTNPSEMTDGILPTEFPPIISDANQNRLVDDDEWKLKVSETPLGSVSGGVTYGVPNGKQLDTKGLPTKSNAAYENAKQGYYDGNLVLVGTAKEPITIDGTLAVNGDVMIKGVVKGAGKILARNNIYFAGDTVYADGERFGEASDGTENLMSYGAGGNIVIGDFLTPETYPTKYGKNKIITFDDSIGAKYPSYLSAETMDLGSPMDQGYSASFSSAQMAMYNQAEYNKAQTTKGYTPRYYAVQPGGKIYRQSSDVTMTDYESWMAKEITAKETVNAQVKTLLPASKWITADQLKLIWWNEEKTRSTDVEERFRIDGLLYTNNAIMGSAHSENKHKSRIRGTLEVRGAIVAADVGILAPGDTSARKNEQGFRLYYDKRVRGYMPVSSAKDLALVRGIRLFDYGSKGL